ncbi:MAG: hypothetical protein CMK59_09130 [Proteobacteria bacterium]|nr:hypothetical protein [Pseudomonadota bacterium]
MKRRLFLKKSFLTTTALSLNCRAQNIVTPKDSFVNLLCDQTLPDQEGPYHRESMPTRSNLHIYEEDAISFQLKGTISSSDCLPISAATLQIWHANALGDYDTDSPDFRYYGQTTTDSEGRFTIDTIYPGAYLNKPPDIYRPRHFHIKILVSNQEKLTTQLYFDNDSYLSFEAIPSELILNVVEDTPFWHSEYEFIIS